MAAPKQCISMPSVPRRAVTSPRFSPLASVFCSTARDAPMTRYPVILPTLVQIASTIHDSFGSRCGIMNSVTPSRLLAKHAAPSQRFGFASRLRMRLASAPATSGGSRSFISQLAADISAKKPDSSALVETITVNECANNPAPSQPM